MPLVQPAPLHPLGERQYEAVTLHAEGYEYAEIAAIMRCSVHTVKNLLAQARRKLRVHTTLQAAFELKRLERKGAK